MKATVKEIIDRELAPAFRDIEFDSFNFFDMLQKGANLIHRNSLMRPANIVICSPFIYYHYFLDHKDFSGYSKKFVSEYEKFFYDAKFSGVFNNRFFVYVSQSISDEEVLVALMGDGNEYNTRCETDVPMVDIIKSSNKIFQKGQIPFWGFLKRKVE